jgi:hypothetical protein
LFSGLLAAEQGHVTATDVATGYLAELPLPNLMRHDVRTDDSAGRRGDHVAG